MTNTLIVEDDPDLADLLAIILRRDGHDVMVTSNGIAALHLVQTRRFDLVVMDQNLPGLTGLEVVEMATRVPGGPRFVIVTGQPWMHLKRSSRVDRFVAKPFDPRVFVRTVRDILDGPGLVLTPCP